MTRVSRIIVIEALRELADEDIQHRRWTAALGPEVGSLVEATERLLDDSGLGDALDEGEVFGQTIDVLLRRLAGMLLRIDATRPPEMVLADPSMAEVRKLAADALALIDGE